MIFRWTRVILAIPSIAIVLAMTVRTPFDFHYPRGINNDPLLKPYQVRFVQDRTLHLEDGRIQRVDVTDAGWRDLAWREYAAVASEPAGS